MPALVKDDLRHVPASSLGEGRCRSFVLCIICSANANANANASNAQAPHVAGLVGGHSAGERERVSARWLGRRVRLLDVYDLHIAASDIGIALIVADAGIAAFVTVQCAVGSGDGRIG